MRLLELRIDALPGVDAPFSITAFTPGVNLLLGPNASGKSRVAHALRCLVDPEASRGHPIHVRGRFEHEGAHWTAERIGDPCSWRKDGVASEPPPLPDPALLDAWFLRLEDLTEAGGSDAQIARSLATELAGGVDLPAVRERLVTVGPQRFAALRTAFDEAREARRRAERDSAQLAHDHDRLHEREERLDRAVARSARLPALEAALAALDAGLRRHEVEARLAAFPAGMANLHGGAEADAERWTRDVARAEQARLEAEADARRADDDVAASGLPHDRPDREEVEALRGRAVELARTEAAVDEARLRSEEAAAHARLLGADVADAATDDSPSAFPDLATLDQLDVLEASLRAAEQAQAEAERALAASEPQDDPRTLDVEAERLRDDARALAGWLAAPNARRRALAIVRPLAWSGALVAAIVALTLASEPDTWPRASLAWLVASGSLGVTAIASEVATRSGRGRHDYERLLRGRDAVDDWTEAGVERALQRRLRATGAVERRRDEALRAEAGQEEAQARLAQAQHHRADAQERLYARARAAGLDPDRTGRSALERARHARAVREAAAALAAARARLTEEERRQARARERVHASLAALAPFDVDGAPAADATAQDVTRWGDALAARVRRRDEALQRAVTARRSVEEAQGRLHEAERTRSEGLAALLAEDPQRVASEPEAMLVRMRERLELRDAWTATRRELERLDDRIATAREAFADDVEAVAGYERGDRAGLASAREASLRASTEVDDHREELARHDERVRAARRARQLDGARRDERRARDALDRAYDDALTSDARAWALDRVETTFRSERRPATLAAASAWFSRFTHHAYGLDLSPAQHEPGLEIVERASGAVLAPSHASSGTRAQALLALRIAHAASAESDGVTLPFVLDEALTTSDADRFAAVAEALAEIAREQDRQILYLSARRDDAALWTRLAADSDGRVPAPTILDLPSLRGADRRWDTNAADRGDSRASAPPAPQDDDAARYAATLGVPAIDPWRVASLHPFHVLRDRLDLVHRLATLRIADLGALEALLADDALRDRVLGSDAALLVVRVRAAHAWAEAWRTGRGRPVDVTVLADSCAVSDRFLERVAVLANELDGDGASLIAALEGKRVANFRTEARRDLAAYLDEHGYLGEREPSSAAQRALASEAVVAPEAAIAGVDGATLARWLDEGLVRSKQS